MQALLSAQLCDAAAAAVLKDSRQACRVPYSSAAYLSTAAHMLNIPVEVQQGVRYCYPLPAETGTLKHEHCQVW